jgi:hypothetical protein
MTESDPPCWLLLITSQPGDVGAARVRLWRGIKGLGAAVLRDGVYLLPQRESLREALAEHAEAVRRQGGTAYLLELGRQDGVEAGLRALFDRGDEYRDLIAAATALQREAEGDSEAGARRRLRKLRRDYAALVAIDYFPGAGQGAAARAIEAAEGAVNRRFSPDEPAPAAGPIERLDPAAYLGRTWGTRRRLWVDRVASAWLIRRFIDPDARFVWLDDLAGLSPEVVGFDFDGATFTHVGQRVTFEVLIASFGLEGDPGLTRLAELVHYLDAGGTPVAEAAGFEAILAGSRERCLDDDQLLAAMGPILDALYTAGRQALAPP